VQSSPLVLHSKQGAVQAVHWGSSVLRFPQVPAAQSTASTHAEPSKKVYVPPSGYTHFVQLVADVSHSAQGGVQAAHTGSAPP